MLTITTGPHNAGSLLPTDGPFLLAALIGAKRAGDTDRVRFLRDCLNEIGLSVRFARDARAIRPDSRESARPATATAR